MLDLLVLLAAGLVIGGVLGLLGGGGSILAVPALVYLGGQSAQAATSASLVVVGLGALGGLATHLRNGQVRVRQGLLFGAVGIAGSFAGSRLNRMVSEDVLIGAFVALLLVVAAMMFRRRAGRASSPQGDGQVHPVRVVVAGTFVGFLTGFLGVGGGFVVVPALVLAMGFTMPVAVGTSLLVIVVNAAAALTARLGSLDIPWAMTAALAAGTTTGSWLGGWASERIEPARLTAGFASLLVVIASVMGIGLVTG